MTKNKGCSFKKNCIFVSKNYMNMKTPHVICSRNTNLDEEYVNWIVELKQRYHKAQIKAAIKVNSERLLFNWQLGRDLVERKAVEKWGDGIVEQVSMDLQNTFPKEKGFSTRNLWNMKKWYEFYTSCGEKEFLQQLVAELQWLENQNITKLQQLGAEIRDDQKYPFPKVFGYVPWGHHIEIITKCKTINEALFYIRKTVEEGLSRSALENYVDADLYKTESHAVSNFKEILPEPQSDLAQEIIKSNYDFGFIELPPKYDEFQLEEALTQNITRFLLELGKGFAFLGNQKEIIVSGKTRKIDLLFYHIHLRCYVVLELKAKPFEPEFAGKLNYYVNAVDELLKTDNDNPSIGILICKSKDVTDVKWAFKGIETPLGVASYNNVKIKKYLPTTEELQKRILLAEKELELLKKQRM